MEEDLCKLDRKVDSEEECTSILSEMDFSKGEQRTFWIMNKEPFDRIKSEIDAAYEKSESCTALRSIISKHKSAEQYPFLGDSTNTKGLVLLRQRRMATISNICLDMIISSEIPEGFKDVLAAYRETWDVVKFVDFPENIVVDPLNIFGTLNFQGFMDSNDCEDTVQIVEREMSKRSSTSLQGHPERVEKPEARTKQRIKYDILNLITPRAVQTKLDVDRLSINEWREMVYTLLCHVIVSAVLEAPDVLLKCTKQWAGNCDERRIEGAIQIAVKVSRFLEMMGDAATHAGLEIEGKLSHFFEKMQAEETRGEGPSEITTT